MKTIAACSTLALGVLGLAPQSVAAQATVPAWREITIYASDASYPQALVRQGVQGMVAIELTPGTRGRKAAATVRASSRSADLDALALGMAKRLDIAGADGAPSGMVTYGFRKDHPSTIATKTCADLNVDVAYHSATFPERSLRELPVFYESVGKLIYSFQREGEHRTFPPADTLFDATLAGCARTPQAGMLDVMRQEALKLIAP
ncbi:TonB family protein [Massilia aurea]|uniref:TonB family protein n=1 Tax=Massilia aurea TaxID=373040 RepID=A0A7W9X487_9BURK|nr:energy transducer TonB [Massilia aurea]MBB6136237.1 TonB family protein [Massilia aurea]